MLILLASACSSPASDKGPSVEEVDTASTDSDAREERPVPPPAEIEAPARLVAVGDVHGDLDATLSVLQLAGLIDESGAWTGGETVLVQTGDQLDRGDGEQAILDTLEALADQAWAAGGAIYVLNGNHEVMNVQLDLRYVTEGGFEDFADTPYDPSDDEIMAYPEEERGRVAAFRPGGVYAQLLAGRNTVMKVGDTVFVHGGVESAFANVALDDVNASIQAWMLGEAEDPEAYTNADDGPLWSRRFSEDPDTEDCQDLADALERLGSTRMVVGHTVQDAINPGCDERIWRIDVGMSAYYGGTPQALEIMGDAVTPLD